MDKIKIVKEEKIPTPEQIRYLTKMAKVIKVRSPNEKDGFKSAKFSKETGANNLRLGEVMGFKYNNI